MIEHAIIKAKNYAYIAVKQSPDYQAFVKASLNFVMDPDFVPELNRLCDFSQADLSHITLGELNAYTKFAKSKIPAGSSTRVALVTLNESRLWLFRAFVGRFNSRDFKIFADPGEASVWLSEAIPVAEPPAA